MREATARRPRVCFFIAVLVSLAAAATVAFPGCSQSEQAKAEDYRTSYVEIIDSFEEKTAKTDEQVTRLVEENDLSELIRVNNDRKQDIDQTFEKILELDPARELWRVHSLTLFYLTSLADMVDAQDDYYQALLTSKPSEDLKTIAESTAFLAKSVGRELAAELQNVGIELKSVPEPSTDRPETSAPEGQQQSAPGGEEGESAPAGEQ